MLSGIMALPAVQDGLTFRGILGKIPSDPASVFVYVLLLVVVGWVVWGSRKRGKPAG